MPKIIKNNSGIQNGASQYFYNFDLQQHVESRKEYSQPQAKSNNEKIAKFKFIYKNYIEQYEEYIKELNPREQDLISFYDFIEYFYPNATTDKIVDPATFFNKGLVGVDTFSKNRDTFYIDFATDNVEYTNSITHAHNIFKNMFPFYMEMQFDSILGDNIGLVDLLEEYKLKKMVIERFNNSDGLLEITPDTFINDSFLDIDFFVKFEQLKNKTTFSNLSNATTKYEVLAYRLQKYLARTGFLPTQEWLIPSSNKKMLEVVDSQIKYGTNYYYKLSTIVAVNGAKYSNTNNISDVQPTFFVMEIDSTDYEGKLISSPPTPPEVQFIPVMDSRNKIKIFLTTNVGKRVEKAIPVYTDEDSKVYRDLVGTEIYDVSTNEIQFESMVRNKSYQVLKLNMEPKNITDFANGELYEMSDGLDCFVDELPLNKKHYYIFRSVDVHGLVSNPTHVYVAEMVSSDGATYPVFGIYDFKNIDTLKEPFKTFRRFFSVTPQINHLFSPEENAALSEQVNNRNILQQADVGISTPSVWGKRFKIRLTSISTGKKIDFNLAFKKTKR